MKKRLLNLFLLLLCGLFIFNPVYAATASFSGSATVNAGGTVSVNLSVSQGNIWALNGTLSYDSKQVELVEIKKTTASQANLSTNGNYFVLEDSTNFATPISSGPMLTAVFKVFPDVEAGTTVNISVANLHITSEELSDINIASLSHTVTVQKKSSNCDLKSLSVDGFTLTPSFNADITTYDIGKVPNATSSVTVHAEAADAKASVKVENNTNLPVGSGKVKITVTAEDGTQKVYQIIVTREKAAASSATSSKTSSKTTGSKTTSSKTTGSKTTGSKTTSSTKNTGSKATVSTESTSSVSVSSTNTASVAQYNKQSGLSELRIEGFELSPTFRPEVLEYTVTVPNITENVLIYAVAEQANAKGVTVAGGQMLKVGENIVTVTCKGADGSQTVYTVTVIRSEDSGASCIVEPLESEPTSSAASEDENSEPQTKNTGRVSGLLYVAVAGIALVLLLIGAMIGFALRGALDKKQRRW